MATRKNRRRIRAGITTVLGVSLVAGIGSYVPPTEAQAYERSAPTPQKVESVKGGDFQGKRDLPPEPAAASPTQVRAVEWPKATSSLVPLAATNVAGARVAVTSKQRVATSPVTIQAADRSSTTGAPDAVRVDVLPQEQSETLGVRGMVVRLASPRAARKPGKVRLEIDYSGFQQAYGADWESRLRLVRLDCSGSSRCDRVTAVPGASRDTARMTLAAVVPVPASASGTAMSAYAVTAAADGPNGAYSATALSPASTWSAGQHTGDFTWSYPLRVPPGTAGPRPELSVGYSSGAVDGQTASTNNQGSWLGQGQSLEAGFIERKYVSCADDMTASSNNKSKTGDQCWRSDNATLSLGSHSSELFWDSAQQKWKLRKDDGSRIERLSGAENGAINGPRSGEHWRLTTTDGTQYYFGLNAKAYGESRTNSVSFVPVFGNNAGEPCYEAGSFAGSQCQQAWRWNVDRVVDTSGNVMTYRYVQEKNNYGRNNNTAVSTYDRASYLSSIEYGERSGSDASSAPPARVIFGVAERCFPSGSVTCAPEQLTAANASHWKDVPFDQICTSSTTCPGKTSPGSAAGVGDI